MGMLLSNLALRSHRIAQHNHPCALSEHAPHREARLVRRASQSIAAHKHIARELAPAAELAAALKFLSLHCKIGIGTYAIALAALPSRLITHHLYLH